MIGDCNAILVHMGFMDLAEALKMGHGCLWICYSDSEPDGSGHCMHVI